MVLWVETIVLWLHGNELSVYWDIFNMLVIVVFLPQSITWRNILLPIRRPCLSVILEKERMVLDEERHLVTMCLCMNV